MCYNKWNGYRKENYISMKINHGKGIFYMYPVKGTYPSEISILLDIIKYSSISVFNL